MPLLVPPLAVTAFTVTCAAGRGADAFARALATRQSGLVYNDLNELPCWIGRVPGLEDAPLPHSARERKIVDDFSRAFERGDVDAVLALLTDDIRVTMPPMPMEYEGLAAVGHLLTTVAMRDGRRYRLVPTRANGQPAFGAYVIDPRTPIAHAHGLLVLTLSGTRIRALTRFVDSSVLPYFGLPRTLRSW